MTAGRVIGITAVCLAAVGGLLWVARAGRQAPAPAERPVTLMVHAGAGIRPALDELGARYTAETGVKIEYNYKGSGCLLADICASRKGDAYIPGELYYIEQAVQRDLVSEYRVVANLTTVLVVQPGNPKGIEDIRDLTRPGMRVGIGEPEMVAVGRAAREVLTRAGVWDKMKRNIVMEGQNVSEVGNAVKLGHIDAGIVWDATAALYSPRELTTVEVPEKWRVVSPVPVGVLSFSRFPEESKQFLAFLASDEAEQVFKKHGFATPVPEAQKKPVTKGEGV